MRTSFLILHYNEKSLTDRAVQSILRMDDGYERDIVIVDNCSPNGSGKELIREYGESSVIGANHIYVILNRENGGFSKGNNVGFRFIKDKLDTDFIVAMNNDISFPQQDFIKRLYYVYDSKEPKFYLAGPDIYAPNIRSHISPLDKCYKDKEALKRRMQLIDDSIGQLRKSFSPGLFMRYLQDKYESSTWLKLYNTIRKGSYDAALKSDEPAYDCVLNGACLIFDRRYIEENDYLFEEKTFMYAEEDFLTYRLVKGNKSIRYCPEILAYHVGQGSAGFTGMNYRQYCDKNIMINEKCREAFRIYGDYIS